MAGVFNRNGVELMTTKLIQIGSSLASTGPPYSLRDKAGGIIFYIGESQGKGGRNS